MYTNHILQSCIVIAHDDHTTYRIMWSYNIYMWTNVVQTLQKLNNFNYVTNTVAET